MGWGMNRGHPTALQKTVASSAIILLALGTLVGCQPTFLAKEVFDKKLQAEIPRLFKELHDQADPQLFLKAAVTEEDIVRRAGKELQSGSDKATMPPHTN